jgi:hypothetical protein
MSTINDPWYSVGSPVDSLTVSSTGGPYTLTDDVSGISVPWTSTGSNTITLNHGWNNTASAKIQLNGPNADIEVNGESLMDMLRAIEDRLNILKPNLDLEKDWDELRMLGDQYRKIEAKIQAKMKTWDAISK